MFSLFFSVLGIILLAYVAFIVLAFILKISIFSSLVGGAFVVGSIKSFSSKWWAWVIQTPFLVLYGMFIYFEGWTSIGYILFLQFLVSALLFALYQMTTPN